MPPQNTPIRLKASIDRVCTPTPLLIQTIWIELRKWQTDISLFNKSLDRIHFLYICIGVRHVISTHNAPWPHLDGLRNKLMWVVDPVWSGFQMIYSLKVCWLGYDEIQPRTVHFRVQTFLTCPFCVECLVSKGNFKLQRPYCTTWPSISCNLW